jgi:phospholipid/cholesterol/gamma-HCH transport system permease protein
MFGGLVEFVGTTGELGMFGAKATRELFRRPLEIAEVIRQIYECGAKSTPLIACAGLALGVVMAMHSQDSMKRFGAQALVPQAVSIGMFRVLGPLVTGLLISGRVGAGIGSQLGGMRVTQQIDALEALAVDSFKYLVVTRVLACIVALPVLTLVMDFAGLTGGMLLDLAVGHVSPVFFLKDAFQALGIRDYLPTVLKTTVFGLIIGTVSCYLGYNTRGGASGVGTASTRSVVFCSLTLILIDIILVKLSFFWSHQ